MYVDADGHADPAAEAQRLLGRLRAGEDLAGLGDQTLLNTAYSDLSRDEIARQFGEDFAEALAGLEPGSWSEPVRSPYGMHLVLVTQRRPARQPQLVEVRDAVLAEWRDQRRRESREQAYRRLRERYDIVMEQVSGRGRDGIGARRAAAHASQARAAQ